MVSNRSIRRYRWRRPAPIGTQRWRTFLVNEMKGIWAADLFTVQTARFSTLRVIFLITHERRELVHLNVTSSPTAAWIWQQVVNATPWGRHPTHLIHDRDASYGQARPRRLAGLGIIDVQTPFRAPKANAIAERLVRTIRQECLDHVIVLNERHPRRVLSELAAYYNNDRPPDRW